METPIRVVFIWIPFVVKFEYSKSAGQLDNGNRVSLKLRWQRPGVARRADLVVIEGRRAMAVRERRSIEVLTRAERFRRARPEEKTGKTEGARNEVNREII